MKLHSFFIILSIAATVFGCNSVEKETYDDDKEFQYEIKVLNEIFVDLTKEMAVSYGYPKAPPPPKPLFGKKGKIIEYDSTLYLQRIEKYQIDTANFRIEDRSILLAVSDSMFQIKDEDIPLKNQLPFKDYNSIFKNNKFKIKPTRKTPIDSLKRTGHFYLKYSSQFKTADNNLDRYYWNIIDNGGFGAISISRIYFNKKKTLGIFLCGYYSSGLDALGGPVFIRKVNNKWIIEVYKMSWIS